MLWIHHLVNVETTVLADEKETEKLDHIITVSNTTANKLKNIFPKIANKILAIYNVINDDEINKQNEARKETIEKIKLE